MSRLKLCGALMAVLAVALTTSPASAHGFGQRFDLPVPLGSYIIGAGAVVLLSFVAVSGVLAGRGITAYPRLNLLRGRAGRMLAHPALLEAVKVLSVALFALFVMAGLFGTSSPNRNFAPTAMWVIFWVGLAYFCAFIGNLWALINPWKIIFGWADAVHGRLTGRRLARNQPYPPGLGSWPAVVLFFQFAWVEVVSPDSSAPRTLAVLALLYTALTLAGMFWFGRDVWLRRGEVFSIVFGYMATLAPTEARFRRATKSERRVAVNRWQVSGAAVDTSDTYVASDEPRRELNLRPWGAGLLAHAPTPRRVPVSLSQAALIVLLLSTVTFDGFSETGRWAYILTEGYLAFSSLGPDAITLVNTLGLIATPVLFFAAFVLTAALMRMFGASSLSTLALVRAFAPTLIPIAVAYHVAHFAAYLVMNGQRIVPLVSDPLDLGWDLFSTASHVPNTSIVSAGWVWTVSVAAIVIGHVVAVYAAHIYAVRLFPERRQALLSQVPMAALMVGYTMVSLWIVAQPIVQAF